MKPDKLQQLQDIVKILDDDKMSMKDFNKFFNMFLDALKQIKSNIEKSVDEKVNGITDPLSKEDARLYDALQASEKSLSSLIATSSKQTLLEATKAQKQAIKDAMDSIEPFNPSYLENKINEVESKIPTLPEPFDDQDIQNSIDDIKKEIEAIKKEQKNKISGGSAFFGRQLRIAAFSFNGDGTTIDFYLPTQPIAYGLAINVFYQGQWMQPIQQYTLNKKKMTMTFTPDIGTIINGYLFF